MTDPAAREPADAVTPDPAEHDLELTVSALKDGPAALGISGALVEIRRWQERIDGTDAPALQEIEAALAELGGPGEEGDGPDQLGLGCRPEDHQSADEYHASRRRRPAALGWR